MKPEENIRGLVGGSPDKLTDAAKAFEQLRDAEKQALDELNSSHAEVQRPALERAFKDMHKLQDATMIQFMEILQDEIRNKDTHHNEAMKQLKELFQNEIRDLRERLETASLIISEFSPVLASVRALVDAKKDFRENGIKKLEQIGRTYTDFDNLAKDNGTSWYCNELRSIEEHLNWHNLRTGELNVFLSDVFDIIDDMAVLYDFPAASPSKQDVSKCFNRLQQLQDRDAEFHPGYKDYDERKFCPWLDKCKQWYKDDAYWIKESLFKIDVANNQNLQDARDNVFSNIDQQLAPALDSLQAFCDALNNILILAEAYNPIKE